MAEIETSWSKENDVDDYVKDKLRNLGLEKASGKYGRFDEAVKKIDPRKE